MTVQRFHRQYHGKSSFVGQVCVGVVLRQTKDNDLQRRAYIGGNMISI